MINYYPRGKVRCMILKQGRNFTNSGIRYTQVSGLEDHLNTDDSDSKFINKIISIVKTPDSTKEELQEFINCDLHNFKGLTASKFTNQRLIPRKIEYKTIVNLNGMIKDNQVRKALELVNTSYKQEIFLNSNEFQNLFIQFLPFNWYAYKLLHIYENKYDFTKFHPKVLELIMKVSYSNFDFKLFDKIFQEYQNKNENGKIPYEILMNAIQVYLKTENIHIATQLFNQQVMSEEELPNRVLDLFISNLYNETKNVNLCLSSYRLWLSKNNNTNNSIDSFMYNLLLESNNMEDIQWIENSLQERQIDDKFVIKFGNICNDLSKNRNSYENFIGDLKEINKYKDLALKDNELTSFLNNLTYLHLRHKNYRLALETFKKVDTRKDFQLTIFSILRHFEKEQKPEIIFEFLKKLKEDSNYKIHWSHILIYWRTLIKKYPHLGFDIQKGFKKSIKKSKYHRFSFLNKILLVNKQTGNSKNARFYPLIKYDNLTTCDFKPLNVAPRLTNIESRLYTGILPNNELLRKSISLTKDQTEFIRLVELCNDLNLKSNLKYKNVKLNIEIFFKEKYFGNNLSVREFVDKQFDLINKSDYIEDNDLNELFKLCVKYQLYSECLTIINFFDSKNIKIVGDQQVLKFLSMFIKLLWNTKDFKKLIIILEWLKTQNEVTTDVFFWENLKLTALKNLAKIENELNDNINCTIEDKEFVEVVMPKIINYYGNTLGDIKEKNLLENGKITTKCHENFTEIIKWVDEDTEKMFEGEW